LQVTVNGGAYEVVSEHIGFMPWQVLPLRTTDLRAGRNVVELWCDSAGLDGWSLSLEPKIDEPQSALSLDGGQTWRNEAMSVYHQVRAEYVVRLRLDLPGSAVPEPPEIAWEAPDSPLFEAVRAAVPDSVKDIADPWERALALGSWVASHWAGDGPATTFEYAPWDPFAILAWRQHNYGLARSNPVLFCVHAGVLFTTAALALGLPTRNFCITPGLNLPWGHFICEVWLESTQAWAQIDPKCDLVFLRHGQPMSIREIQQCEQPGEWAVEGPMFAAQGKRIHDYARDHLYPGTSFRHAALWPRNDHLSRPDLTPPSHGVVSYVERDWIWLDADPDGELGMFTYHAAADALYGPPPTVWRG